MMQKCKLVFGLLLIFLTMAMSFGFLYAALQKTFGVGATGYMYVWESASIAGWNYPVWIPMTYMIVAFYGSIAYIFQLPGLSRGQRGWLALGALCIAYVVPIVCLVHWLSVDADRPPC